MRRPEPANLIDIRRGDLQGMELMASVMTNPIDAPPWNVALLQEKQHLLVLESALEHLRRTVTEAWGDEAKELNTMTRELRI